MREQWDSIRTRLIETFPGLRDQWERRQLNAKERRLIAKNVAVHDRAKKEGKSREDLDKLQVELMAPVWELRDERNRLETRHLLSQMNILGLPISDDETLWNSRFNELTAEGRAVLRSAIRKERAERWDLPLKVLPLVIGLIGVLIGLVSALKD